MAITVAFFRLPKFLCKRGRARSGPSLRSSYRGNAQPAMQLGLRCLSLIGSVFAPSIGFSVAFGKDLSNAVLHMRHTILAGSWRPVMQRTVGVLRPNLRKFYPISSRTLSVFVSTDYHNSAKALAPQVLRVKVPYRGKPSDMTCGTTQRPRSRKCSTLNSPKNRNSLCLSC